MPGATFEVSVYANRGPSVTSRRAVGLTSQSPTLIVELEETPVLESPAEDATGVAVGTTLRWSNPTGRASYVLMEIDDDPKGAFPSYHVVTANHSIAIPDISNRGVVLSSQAKGHWSVHGTSLATVDDLAAYGTGNPNLPQRSHTYSPFRSFTTK